MNGVNMSDIVFLLFLMAIRLPSFSDVTLLDGASGAYGVLSPQASWRNMPASFWPIAMADAAVIDAQPFQ